MSSSISIPQPWHGSRASNAWNGITTKARCSSELWQIGGWRREIGLGTGHFTKLSHRSQETEQNFVCGRGNPRTGTMDSLVVPRRASFCVIVKCHGNCRNQALRNGFGKWRVPDFVKVRSVEFKFGNNPAKFVCQGQRQGSQSEGPPEQEIGGQLVPKEGAAKESEGNAAPDVAEVDSVRNVSILGAGAGAKSMLEYCQRSSILPSAEFWYSPDSGSEFVNLSGNDEKGSPTSNSAPEHMENSHAIRDKEIVFVVLGGGTGTGIGSVFDQLQQSRSKASLIVGIFIMPFQFEGVRRMEQANEMIQLLLECTNMLLVVEQNALLNRDRVTLSEASSLASNAVLLAVRGVVDVMLGKEQSNAKSDINSANHDDAGKVFQNSKRVWLGFGRGRTCKEAVIMAALEAPILDHRSFESKHFVICTLANTVPPSEAELEALKPIFHRAMGPDIQIIIHCITIPTLESCQNLATVILTRTKPEQPLSSQLADKTGPGFSLPKFFGINKSNSKQTGLKPLSNTAASFNSDENQSHSAAARVVLSSPKIVSGKVSSSSTQREHTDATTQSSRTSSTRKISNKSPGRIPAIPTKSRSPTSPFTVSTREDVKNADESSSSSSIQASSGPAAGRRSRSAWETGPNSDVAKAWAQARAEARNPAEEASLDVALPVGVREWETTGPLTPSENYVFSTGFEVAEDKWIGNKVIPVDPDARPRNGVVNMGLEAVRDIYNAASALVMGRETPLNDEQQAPLSQRAASMLESERSRKELTPMVEMGFKNGIYKGRCQAGLPEGKGRLSFSDGSLYDGHWRQGRRAGGGAFYYTNGDMFQGSWKDDVMHGKGWMYYHNGDRLYANFWRGKAEGEGRFYSSQGDVFFGQFRDNWRHGEFLYIEASGVRWSELWDNGVLNRRAPADY